MNVAATPPLLLLYCMYFFYCPLLHGAATHPDGSPTPAPPLMPRRRRPAPAGAGPVWRLPRGRSRAAAGGCGKKTTNKQTERSHARSPPAGTGGPLSSFGQPQSDPGGASAPLPAPVVGWPPGGVHWRGLVGMCSSHASGGEMDGRARLRSCPRQMGPGQGLAVWRVADDARAAARDHRQRLAVGSSAGSP